MKKDAYWFPHYCNARNDRKIKRLRKELGLEGYGIFFMLLETLRDQSDLKYPMDDLDLLSEEFGTSEQKLRIVICSYGLFEIDKEEKFFSPKLLVYLQPYFERTQRAKRAALKRWGDSGCSGNANAYANAYTNALPEHSKCNASQNARTGQDITVQERRGQNAREQKTSDKADTKAERPKADSDDSRLNSCPVPPALRAPEIIESYKRFMEYSSQTLGIDRQPIHTEGDFRRLVELMTMDKDNDPVRVIWQTIQAGNKTFYPLKDKQFEVQKKSEREMWDEEYMRRQKATPFMN